MRVADEDDELRAAAFAFLRNLTAQTGGFVTRQDLRQFTFRGRRISLEQNMRGIRVVSGHSAAISILTTYAARPELIEAVIRAEDLDDAEVRFYAVLADEDVPVSWREDFDSSDTEVDVIETIPPEHEPFPSSDKRDLCLYCGRQIRSTGTRIEDSRSGSTIRGQLVHVDRPIVAEGLGLCLDRDVALVAEHDEPALPRPPIGVRSLRKLTWYRIRRFCVLRSTSFNVSRTANGGPYSLAELSTTNAKR